MKRTICMILATLVLCAALPAQAAGKTSKTALKVMGTNGTVTVAMRTLYGPDAAEADDKRTLLYSTDGVNWRVGETPADFAGAYRGYWAKGQFWLCPDQLSRPNYRSADGVHWTGVKPEEETVGYAIGMADLGGYHFELDMEGALFVSRSSNEGYAVEIPAIREAQAKNYAVYTQVQAYYTAPETVTLEICDNYDKDGAKKFTASYSESSLEWCLDNLPSGHDRMNLLENTQYQDWVYLGTYPLAGPWGLAGAANRVLVQYHNGAGWERVKDVPWGPNFELLPYNGKTFLVHDKADHTLYASEDGGSWRSLRTTFLYPEQVDTWTYDDYSFVWTGTEYITSRRVARGRHSIMGSAGGDWASPYCSKVSFCDENFNETYSYDFGRQVEGVGYWNGVYCAQVSEDPGIIDQDRNGETASMLYLSTDKVSWERTDLLGLMQSLRANGT